jgi:hypothetical membrane protein
MNIIIFILLLIFFYRLITKKQNGIRLLIPFCIIITSLLFLINSNEEVSIMENLSIVLYVAVVISLLRIISKDMMKKKIKE